MEALKPSDNNDLNRRIRNAQGSLIKERHDEIVEIMKNNGIFNLTFDFEDDRFIYFQRFDDQVKCIQGNADEYIHLQKLLKANTTVPKLELDNVSIVDSDDHVIDKESNIIHQSLFTPLLVFEQTFKKASVFFEPYEAPGGDFYWCKNYTYKTIVIVGDCTGHGMQGAMIAMSVMTLLKQHFKLLPNLLEEEIKDIYKEIKAIKEYEDNGFLDCELGIIVLDKRSNELEYVGSGINLIVKRDYTQESYFSRKARLLMGKQQVIKLKLEKGDEIFLFSDGITDQFDKHDKTKLRRDGLYEMVRALPRNPSDLDFKEKMDAFRGFTKSLDDQTMLMLTI